MLDEAERRRLTWVGRAAIKRHAQVLPHAGERAWIVVRSRREYLCLWRKWLGLQVLAVRPVAESGAAVPWNYFDEDWWMPIKRRVFDTTTLSLPDLPNATKLFAKFPTFVAFLTARSYEDGQARLPGKFWFDASTAGFQITLIDVDQAMRLVVRAAALDDVWAAAELALGTDNAPWEVDQYHAQKAAEKKKKK